MKKALTHSLVFSLSLQAFGVTAQAAYVEPPPVPCAKSLLAAAHAPSEDWAGKSLRALLATRRAAALEKILLLIERLEAGATQSPSSAPVQLSLEENLSPSRRAFLLQRLHATFSYSESDPRSTAWLFEGGGEIDALAKGLVCRAEREDADVSVVPACGAFLGKFLMGGGALAAFIAAKSAQYSSMFGSRPARGVLAELLGIPQPEPDYSTQNAMLVGAGLALGVGLLVWAVAFSNHPKPDEAWPHFAQAISNPMRKAVEASEDPRFYSVTSKEREMDLIFWVEAAADGSRTPKLLLLAR